MKVMHANVVNNTRNRFKIWNESMRSLGKGTTIY